MAAAGAAIGAAIGFLSTKLSFLKSIPFLGKLFGGLSSAAGTVLGLYIVLVIVLNLITLLLLQIAGSLIGVAISFNAKVGDAGFVQYGHELILQLANMGFIVALVAIAFATMFRSERFGYKKALPKLIIAALLINFGFFIVTEWFIKPVTDITNSIWDAAGFTDDFTASTVFYPGGLFHESSEELTEAITEEGVPILPDNWARFIISALTGTILGAIFSFIMIIALFAFAFMLFIRGIALSILIILLPIAWIAWVFPGLKIPGGGNPWIMWWESFTRWLLFAPFAIFFFFLAIKFATTDIDKVIPNATAGGLFTGIGQTLAVAGFLIGGLIVSNKMGIMGAGAALGVAAAGKVWAQGQLKKLEAGARTRILSQKGVGTFADKTARIAENRGRFLRSLAAPLRKGGKGVTRAHERAFDYITTVTDKKVADYSTVSIGKQWGGYSIPEMARAMVKMEKAGLLWEIRMLEEMLGSYFDDEAKNERNRARRAMLKKFLGKKEQLDIEAALGGPIFTEDRKNNLMEAKSAEEIEGVRSRWLPGKSRSSANAWERERLETSEIDEGVRRYGASLKRIQDLQQGMGRTLMKPTEEGGRPELLNPAIATAFPEGQLYLSDLREQVLKEEDQRLQEVLGPAAGGVGGLTEALSEKKPEERIKIIEREWPKTDAAWGVIQQVLPPDKWAEVAKLQKRGAEGLIRFYNELMRNRRSLFHYGLFEGGVAPPATTP